MSYDYWSAGSSKDVKWNRTPSSQEGNTGSSPVLAIMYKYKRIRIGKKTRWD